MSFLLPCPNCGPRDVNESARAGTAEPQEAAIPDTPAV